ncbi:MAG: hypothetical protein ACPGR8_16665 [Limisphaerales bacterium]
MGAISRLSETDDLRDIVEMLCNAAMFVAVTVVVGVVVIAWIVTRQRVPPPPAPPPQAAVVLWVFLADSKDESLNQMEEEIIQAVPFRVVYTFIHSVGKLYNPGRPLPSAEFEAIRQQATAFAAKVKSLAEGPVRTTNLDTLAHIIKQDSGSPDIQAYCENVLGLPPTQGTIKAKHFGRVLQWNGITAFIFKHPMCAFNRAFPAVVDRQRRAARV